MGEQPPIDEQMGTPRIEKVQRPPIWTLWFKPGRFHEWSAHRMSVGTLVLLVYVASMARLIDRYSMDLLQGDLGEMMSTWEGYWAFLTITPVFAGVFAYAIWGAWFWFRLKLSGVQKQRSVFSRGARVYFSSFFIIALPTIILQIIQTAHFEDPFEANNTTSWIDTLSVLSLAFPFWASLCSWRGVLAVFDPPRRIIAALVFLVIPWLIYVGAVVVLVWATLDSEFLPAPQLEKPKTHTGASFRFNYPSNWTVDKAWVGFDHDRSIRLLTGADTSLWIQTYWYDGSLSSSLAETRSNIQEDGYAFVGSESEGGVAALTGRMWQGTLTMDGVRYAFEQFAATPGDDDWFVEILYMVHPNADEKLRPGFDLFLDSLEITHPENQAAVIQRTRPYSAAGLSFEYPNNWSAYADLEPAEDNPDLLLGSIDIEAPARSSASALLYYSASGPQAEIDITIDQLVEGGATVVDESPIQSLGSVTGEGLKFRLTYENSDDWLGRILVSRLPDGRTLELREYMPLDRVKRDRQGFGLLWRTLTLAAETTAD